MTLFSKTAAELQSLLHKKELSVKDITEEAMKRVATIDGEVQAFLTITEAKVLERAEQLDKVPQEDRGPLFGLPIGIKDNILTKGIITTAASKMLENFNPIFDATAVEKVNEAGMVTIGKLNMDEFAMGSTTETSAFHKTHNPWDLDYVPGGSSGGSAAAVAAGEVMFSLGSDTGGSVRQPAAYCGVVGMKPTYGRVSRLGLIAMGSSFDQIGPITRTVEDNALLLSTIAGVDAKDSSSSSLDVPNYKEQLTGDIKGLKIGVPKEYMSDDIGEEAKQAVLDALKVLESLGAEWEEVSLPHSTYAPSVYYFLSSAEASSNLARYDGVRFGYRSPNAKSLDDVYRLSRNEGFGEEVKRRILLGTYALGAGHYGPVYKKSQSVRTLIAQDFADVFAKYDLIIGPTTPTPALKIGDKDVSETIKYAGDLLLTPVNLAGVPAISVPCGFSNGLPLGLQIIGNHFDEATIYKVAHAYEKATEFHTRTPAIWEEK